MNYVNLPVNETLSGNTNPRMFCTDLNVLRPSLRKEQFMYMQYEEDE